ncbi:MAG: sugar phosphate isomerase/epimerase [Verrucomicrobia bacterium]|nr:sugar phosphate isomerase/epimerase [Verrucomicrobiota bacterium]
MISPCVTIALVPEIKTGPWIFWEPIEVSIPKAAALGFQAVELFTASADALNADLLRKQLDQHSLRLGAVGTGAGKVLHGLTLTNPDASIRARAVDFITDMIAFGAAFHAPAIIGSMQGVIPLEVERERALAWLADGLALLGQRAEDQGVPLIYEPLNRYETNVFNRLEDASHFIDQLCNVVLLADLFHMNIEEASVPDAIRKAGGRIGHVHFADSNRGPVGTGHIAMGEIVTALRETGYNKYISAEALPFPNPDEAAAMTIRSFRNYFG